jgi:sulfotransferase family protein
MVHNPLRATSNFVRTALSKAGLDQNYRKYFAIGFNKTGTSSIHRVFLASGLYATHDSRWGRKKNQIEIWHRQAFSDGGPRNFARIDRAFPNSRFILNVRDLDAWLDSRIAHLQRTSQRKPRRPDGNWRDTDKAVQKWVRARNRHHGAVLSYFRDRPDDLLVVNFIRDPDAASKIARFCGGPAMAEKPHENPNRAKQSPGYLAHRARIETLLSGMGIPAAEFTNDLFCPSIGLPPKAADFPPDTRYLTDRYQVTNL